MHLHRVVSEEIVQCVVHTSSISSRVIPETLEGQDLSVIEEVLLELLIPAVATEVELVVLLALNDSATAARHKWHGLLDLAGPERVQRRVLTRWHVDVQGALVEGPSEVIAVRDPEDPGVDVDLVAAPEVPEGVVPLSKVLGFGDPVAFHEGSLCNAGVLHLGLCDHHGPVFQVEVDPAMPNPEVFLGALVHRLLKVRRESQHLPVVLQPGRRDGRPVAVPGGLLQGLALVVRDGPGAAIVSVEGVCYPVQHGEVQLWHLPSAATDGLHRLQRIRRATWAVGESLPQPLVRLVLLHRVSRQKGNRSIATG
mmetsp:Transcript_53521/g.120641  ORF Transcript_53521/g.120641 Transcript_53521/m.120641 type:complete len:310 (+) Transcript_53521:1011-1940(+)